MAVRTGRILLLAAAFGVTMPGLVDLSLFTAHVPPPTWIGPVLLVVVVLGIGVVVVVILAIRAARPARADVS